MTSAVGLFAVFSLWGFFSPVDLFADDGDGAHADIMGECGEGYGLDRVSQDRLFDLIKRLASGLRHG